jgi:hypothetical protein
MTAITEFTITALVVALLLAVAFQVSHAQAPVPVVHDSVVTDAAGVKPVPTGRH